MPSYMGVFGGDGVYLCNLVKKKKYVEFCPLVKLETWPARGALGSSSRPFELPEKSKQMQVVAGLTPPPPHSMSDPRVEAGTQPHSVPPSLLNQSAC